MYISGAMVLLSCISIYSPRTSETPDIQEIETERFQACLKFLCAGLITTRAYSQKLTNQIHVDLDLDLDLSVFQSSSNGTAHVSGAAQGR